MAWPERFGMRLFQETAAGDPDCEWAISRGVLLSMLQELAHMCVQLLRQACKASDSFET